MIATWHLSALVFPGFVLGTLLLAGCASVTKSEPSAVAPSNTSSPLPAKPGEFAIPSVAHVSTVGHDRVPEHRRDGTNARERQNADAEQKTLKLYKPLAWSTKAALAGGEEPAAISVVPAVAGAESVPFIYAERRASEARDHLAMLVSIRHEKRGDVITLLCDKLVEPGQWAITSGQFMLRELAAGLRDQNTAILIQGYTDSQGSAAINDGLSLRRAEAVRDYFATQGVAAESMRAEGLGAKRPVASNSTPDGRSQNRRIEIVIVP